MSVVLSEVELGESLEAVLGVLLAVLSEVLLEVALAVLLVASWEGELVEVLVEKLEAL